MSKDNKFHGCTKHIDIRCHFIHKAIVAWNVVVEYVAMEDNIADMFTKALQQK